MGRGGNMDAERVRFWAYEALSGYETLDAQDATEGATLNLLDILLHVTDDPASVALVERIETRIRDKNPIHDAAIA